MDNMHCNNGALMIKCIKEGTTEPEVCPAHCPELNKCPYATAKECLAKFPEDCKNDKCGNEFCH